MQTRRQFLQSSFATLTAAGLPMSLHGVAAYAADNDSVRSVALGDTQLLLLNDGHMQLPLSMILPEGIDVQERDALLAQFQLDSESVQPPCNVTLWQTGDKTILFDTGGGTLFMPTLGNLVDSLGIAGVEPSDVTDVVFTHAHPDHIWGLIDDFDELTFPEANYYINATEWGYWRASDTLDKTPDARKSFVVGAQNRMVFLEDRIQLFGIGDELLPGLEAVDSQGHTPGHTSFALHAGSASVLVVGDALTHPVFSFHKPKWISGSDQNPEQGIATRLALLDRVAADKTPIVGFHLPDSGYGYVEQADGAYRFVTENG